MYRRFAFRVLSLPGVAQSTYRIVVAVLRAISELLPADLRGGPRLRLSTALMLMTAYGRAWAAC